MVHEHIKERGLETDPYVSSGLIDMYSTCSSLENAHAIFEQSKRNVLTCNAMLQGFVHHGNYAEAFKLFHEMQQDVEPNHASVLIALRACLATSSLNDVKRIHTYVIERDF